MREQVIARLRAALEDQGWDGLVVSSPENFAYLAGFVVPSHPLMRWRHAAVVLPVGGDPAVMCIGVEEAMVRQRTGAAEVAVWDEFGDDPMACLAGLLERLGLSRGRMGVELGYLPAADFRPPPGSGARGGVGGRRPVAGEAATDQDPGGTCASGPPVPYLRRFYRCGARIREGGRHRDGDRRRTHRRHIPGRRRGLQADDRGHRSPEPTGQCGSQQKGPRGGGRVQGGDLRGGRGGTTPGYAAPRS